MGYTLRPYQQDAVDYALGELESKKPTLMCLGTGCHAKGYRVLMADGTLKKVEDIEVGDYLMGTDGNRKVLKLHRGVDDMYKITPVKGDPFVVNSGHILYTQKYKRRRVSGKDTYSIEYEEISVLEYLKKTRKYKHCSKLISGNYSYGKTPSGIKSWLIGAYLGDGSTFNQGKRAVAFSNVDETVLSKFENEILQMGGEMKKLPSSDLTWGITFNRTKPHPFKEMMFFAGAMDRTILQKKFPKNALSWSEEDRLELLAGLLDTDGHYDGNGFDFISKYEDISRGVMLLAKSVGVGATMRIKKVRLENWSESKPYYRVHISGHGIERIPSVKFSIKENKQKKQQNITGYKVEYYGVGEFFGFELDGNHLYFDEQMFIQHNSGKTWVIAELAKKSGKKVLVLTSSKELCEQDYEKASIVVGEDKVGMYSASWKRKEVEDITVATIQSAFRHPELWDEHKLIIADECDIMPADGSLSALLPGKKLIGLTATPYATQGSRSGSWYTTKLFPMHKIRTDMGWFWQPLGFCISEADLLKQGYLCPLKIFSSPIQCNLLKTQSNGSEYTKDSLDKWAFAVLDRIATVMEKAENKGMCKSGITFLPSVEACNLLEQYCEKLGISAKAVTYKTDKKERVKIIDAHKSGELKWIINQGVCARGFDNPMVDCLVIARPTCSLRLHRQILGRGLRLAEGKTHCNVLDLTENCKNWGGPEDVVMGKNGWQDTILLRGKDISGTEVSKINLATRWKNKENDTPQGFINRRRRV